MDAESKLSQLFPIGIRIQGEPRVVTRLSAFSPAIDEGILKLAMGADLLIHEGQYTPEELPRFKGGRQ